MSSVHPSEVELSRGWRAEEENPLADVDCKLQIVGASLLLELHDCVPQKWPGRSCWRSVAGARNTQSEVRGRSFLAQLSAN